MFVLKEPGMVGSVEVAKCWAARIGLLKARDLGLNNIVLEGDCKNLFSYLEGYAAL